MFDEGYPILEWPGAQRFFQQNLLGTTLGNPVEKTKSLRKSCGWKEHHFLMVVYVCVCIELLNWIYRIYPSKYLFGFPRFTLQIGPKHHHASPTVIIIITIIITAWLNAQNPACARKASTSESLFKDMSIFWAEGFLQQWNFQRPHTGGPQ